MSETSGKYISTSSSSDPTRVIINPSISLTNDLLSNLVYLTSSNHTLNDIRQKQSSNLESYRGIEFSKVPKHQLLSEKLTLEKTAENHRKNPVSSSDEADVSLRDKEPPGDSSLFYNPSFRYLRNWKSFDEKNTLNSPSPSTIVPVMPTTRHFSEPACTIQHRSSLNLLDDADTFRSHSCRTSPFPISHQQPRKLSTPVLSNSHRFSSSKPLSPNPPCSSSIVQLAKSNLDSLRSRLSLKRMSSKGGPIGENDTVDSLCTPSSSIPIHAFSASNLKDLVLSAAFSPNSRESNKSKESGQLYLIVPSNYPVIVPLNNKSSPTTTSNASRSSLVSSTDGKSNFGFKASDISALNENCTVRSRASLGTSMGNSVIATTHSSETSSNNKYNSAYQSSSENETNNQHPSDRTSVSNNALFKPATQLSKVTSDLCLPVSEAKLFSSTMKPLKDVVNYDSQFQNSNDCRAGYHAPRGDDELVRRLSTTSPVAPSQLIANSGYMQHTGISSEACRRCKNTNEMYISTEASNSAIQTDSPYCSPCTIGSPSGFRFQEVMHPYSSSSYGGSKIRATSSFQDSPPSETLLEMDQSNTAMFFGPNESSSSRHFLSRINCDSKDLRRRVSHNEVERRRRDRINTWISELFKLLPSDQQAKTQSQSKGVVLKRVFEYFQSVHHTIASNKVVSDQLREENSVLAQEVRRLTRENHLLRSGLTVHFAELPPPEALISSLRLPSTQNTLNKLNHNQVVINGQTEDDSEFIGQNRRSPKRPTDQTVDGSHRNGCISMSKIPHTSTTNKQ